MSRKSAKGVPKPIGSCKTQESSDFKVFLAVPSPYHPDISDNFKRTVNVEEEIPLPAVTHERSLNPKEAEAALRDLFNGGTDNSSTFTNNADAVVKAFGQASVYCLTKMGKTIQAVARIADGPLTEKDREDGWKPATLVVCPVGVMQQWEDEIKKFTVGMKVLQFHGPKRDKDAPRLPDMDIVLTSYGTVCSEHSKVNPEDPDKGPVLFTTRWLRIILDEAHTIKNRKTKTAEACWDLRAKFRWCLTATPMQNKVEEFYPLLKFLHIKPLNDWEKFNTLIAKPISKGPGANLAMKRLQVVLKHVMFRRTKAEVASYLKLPQRTVVVLPCKFDPSEQHFYTALKTNVQTLLRKILAKSKNGDGGGSYMNILVLLLRLRQACDHPCLVLDNYTDEMDEISPEPMGNTFTDTDLEDDTSKPKCQVCTSRLTRRNTADKEWPGHCINCAAFKVQAQNLRSSMRASAKIRTITRLLQHIAKDSGGQEKTVIFSQFTAMLDIIEPFLMVIGVDFVRYDGSMSLKERTEALADIEKNPRKTVILVSLKAGGVGMSIEQAFDRTHRVGQTRHVHIYKLKIDDTVEDRILELQEKKRELTKTALSGSHIKNKELGMHELLELFK
ncbi:SNF2 family DNA-dependent ATPase [Mycena leptocephala]|nr:SNF2 family DNA-dependent ATPase [Mycena leptocephala]